MRPRINPDRILTNTELSRRFQEKHADITAQIVEAS